MRRLLNIGTYFESNQDFKSGLSKLPSQKPVAELHCFTPCLPNSSVCIGQNSIFPPAGAISSSMYAF